MVDILQFLPRKNEKAQQPPVQPERVGTAPEPTPGQRLLKTLFESQMMGDNKAFEDAIGQLPPDQRAQLLQNLQGLDLKGMKNDGEQIMALFKAMASVVDPENPFLKTASFEEAVKLLSATDPEAAAQVAPHAPTEGVQQYLAPMQQSLQGVDFKSLMQQPTKPTGNLLHFPTPSAQPQIRRAA